MRRGQTEIIGVVIVVVILIIAALFYVRFAILDPGGPRALSTVRVTQSFNLMNAMINIDLCQADEKSLKAAIAACEQTPSLDFCEGQNACLYIEEKLPEIIDPIMIDTIGLEYTFTAQRGESEILSFGECETGTNSPPLRFKEAGKQYQAFFKLCKPAF